MDPILDIRFGRSKHRLRRPLWPPARMLRRDTARPSWSNHDRYPYYRRAAGVYILRHGVGGTHRSTDRRGFGAKGSRYGEYAVCVPEGVLWRHYITRSGVAGGGEDQ